MLNFNVYTEINETLICTKDLTEVEIPSTFFSEKESSNSSKYSSTLNK